MIVSVSSSKKLDPGSLTAFLALGGALAMGAGGNVVYDIAKIIWKKATGTGPDGDIQIGDRHYRSGDLDALTEAVTPSLCAVMHGLTTMSTKFRSRQVAKF